MEDGSSVRLWPAFTTAFVFATLPYLQLVASNLGGPLEYGRIAWWWGLTVALVGVTVWSATRIGGVVAARRTAVVLAPLLLLFFNYDAVSSAVSSVGIDQGDALFAWFALAAVAVAVMVVPSRARPVQVFVALLGVGLVLLSAGELALTRAESTGLATSEPVPGEAEITPNIWLLLTDGYASPSVVEEVTGLDIGPFIGALHDRGFTIADDARANYPLTFLSMAALFDMDYVVEEGDRVGDGLPFQYRISGANATVETLRRMGYAYVQSPPALWIGSRCMGYEDVCLEGGDSLTETQLALYRATPLLMLLEAAYDRTQAAERSDPVQRVRQALAADLPSPSFIYAHFMNPHPPFLRDAECHVRGDASLDQANPQHDAQEYADMITCLNDRLTTAIDLILERDPDAVILVQSDHGSAVDFSLDEAQEYPDERYSIFSGLRLPESCANEVPGDLVTVNVFRVVIACLQGRDPDLLAERRYMTGYDEDEVRALSLDDATSTGAD